MGHSPPYSAVITLSAITATHWRMVRHKLALAGIAEPMRLPSMHWLLDVTESMVLESMQSNNPDQDRLKRESFLDKLYAPTKETIELNGAGYKPIPAAFVNPEDVEAQFDAFIAGGG